MAITVFEMCQKYYPKLWDESRLQQLLKAGKITEDEYNQLINTENTESK